MLPQKIRTIRARYEKMIADPFRTPLLKRAIQQVVKPDDHVLDLGCGTGCLSFLAVEAGAGHVYACDRDEAIGIARSDARKKGLSDRITFFRKLSSEIQLPQKVDLILAETVGSLAFDENIIPFVYDARNRFLKPGGKIIPSQLKLLIAPVTSQLTVKRPKKKKGVFETKLNFSQIKTSDLLAAAQLYWEVNLNTVSALGYDREMEFAAKRNGTLTGFAGWFEAEWAPGITTNTSPENPLTHWKQGFLPITHPEKIRKGDTIVCRLRIFPKYGPYSTESAIEWGYQVVGAASLSLRRKKSNV